MTPLSRFHAGVLADEYEATPRGEQRNVLSTHTLLTPDTLSIVTTAGKSHTTLLQP